MNFNPFMHMKKILLAIVPFLALVACNKGIEGPQASKPIQVKVDVAGRAATKATGVVSNSSDGEAKVNTLQVLVFNGDALDGYGSSTGMSATVNCTSGSRTIYAVVNGPSLSSITSKTALLATSVTLTENVANFVMIGSKTETLAASGSIEIPVDRLAARVVIRGIKNAHANDALAADFKVKSISLTNVTGDTNLAGNAVPTLWYNRRGYGFAGDNALGTFTHDDIGGTAGVAVAKNASYETAHYFYSMPNGYEGKIGDVWSPRAARLVVQIALAGTVYDYPILLPALESNKSYEINLLTITKNGNLDNGEHNPNNPDDKDQEEPITGFEKNFSITVNDWSVQLLGDNGNISI